MSDQTAASGKLSTGVYAAYGTGWIGGQVFRDVPALILLPFMLSVVGVPPAVAGAAIFLPKLWVVVCDPLMGLLSDRTQSRWGRRRPFLLVGSILCGLTFILLFNVPDLSSGAVKGIYVGAIYLIASTAFSIYSVPYLTLGSEMSGTMHERTVVMSWRQMGLGLGLIAGNAMPFYLVSAGGGGAAGYSLMALVLAGVCFATMITTFFGTASVPKPARVEALVPLKEQVKLAARNTPFLILVAANFAQLVGSAGAYATIAMYMHYRLNIGLVQLSEVLLVLSVVVVVTPPLWTMLSRRIGKKAVFILSIICFIATFLLFGLVREGQMWGVYLFAVALGAFNCGFSLMAFSMLLDAIALDAKISGLNREGVYAGLWSAMDKTAFAFGALLAGLALGYFGYQESTTGFTTQSDETLAGISLTYIGMPVVFAVLSLLIMLKYRLTEKDLAEKDLT
ncbi:MAG: MFS transporter [Rhodospirillaceae bacterium]|nr:MFS transporter [Rhodospirillaceae bacterium]